MDSIKKFVASMFLMAFSLTVTHGYAQSTVSINDIQNQLSQLYQTAKATADGTDIVTAGSVLLLQKDHLLMAKVESAPIPNIYKNGAIAQNGLAGAANFLKAWGKLGNLNPMAGNAGADNATSTAAATREFVAGEKFWATKIDTHSDGIIFDLISDPIKDQRYHATLKFPFAKGAMPSPDDVTSMVSEVIKIDSGDRSQDQGAENQGQREAAPAETKTIAIGQTRDQVVAMFGVPTKVVQLGTKEIDFFSDMKVTFVHSKVVDVQ